MNEDTRSLIRKLALLEATDSWKKSSVQLATVRGKESAQGYVKEGSNLVVHKSLDKGNTWVVSHAPSGLAVVPAIVTQQAAKKIADALIDQFPDFSKADKQEVRKVFSRQASEMKRAIQRLNQQYNKKAPSAKQVASQEKKAAQEQENKAWFDAQAKTFSEAVFNQFILYSEQTNTPLEYSLTRDKQQQALHKAYDRFQYVRSLLRFAEKGLLDNNHKSKTEKAIGEYEAAQKELKKLGIDISKTPEKVEAYLVRYNYRRISNPGKLGAAGPNGDGVVTRAASAHEAETKVGKEQNLNPFYLKAEKLK